MSEHAKYGPSGAQSRDICCGFRNMPGSSEASRQGDRLHAVCEFDGDEDKAAIDYARKQKERAAKDPEHEIQSWIPLDAGEWEWVNTALDYVRSLPSGQLCTEFQIPLTKLGFEGMDFGTADRLSWEDTQHIHMADYKFGWGEITPVEDNFQFIIYALGLFELYQITTKITIHMVQPKLNCLDVHTFYRRDTDALWERISDSHTKVIEFEQTKNVDLLRIDPINCERCRDQGQCPKWHQMGISTASAVVEKGLTKYEEPKEQIMASMIPDIINATWDVATADPLKVSMLMALIPAFEAFFKKFKRFALEVNERVSELPGYSVVTTAGKSDCISPVDIVSVIAQEFVLSENEVISTFKPSLDELKALVALRAPKGEKGKFAERLVELLSDRGLLLKGAPNSYLKRKSVPKSK